MRVPKCIVRSALAAVLAAAASAFAEEKKDDCRKVKGVGGAL